MKQGFSHPSPPQDTINRRIRLLIIHFGEGKNKDFSDATGIPTSTLSSITSTRKVKPATDTIDKIIQAFPEVNREWLTDGRGTMLRQEVQLSLLEGPAGGRPGLPPALSSADDKLSKAEKEFAAMQQATKAADDKLATTYKQFGALLKKMFEMGKEIGYFPD